MRINHFATLKPFDLNVTSK